MTPEFGEYEASYTSRYFWISFYFGFIKKWKRIIPRAGHGKISQCKESAAEEESQLEKERPADKAAW
jgi:hypothetical protein